jgi:phage tail-like protein
MATERQRPYLRHNFLVDITDINDAQQDSGGFQEVSGLGVEIAAAEYRNGNNAFNYPIKVMGLSKVPDVTLKRGVLGNLSLFEWIKAVQEGESDQLKTVTITLLGEDRTTQAQAWKLSNARPLKYTGPPLSGTAGGEVAVEELVLSCERIEQA